jgi:hypothetical protein
MKVEPKITEAAQSPHRLFLYGKPKTGKTTSVSKLPRHLIIDTEVKGEYDGELKGGTSYCDGAYSIVVDGLPRLRATMEYAKEHQSEIDFVVLDTIDHIEQWVTDDICNSHKVKHIGDLPHGKGWSMMKTKVMQIIEAFARISKHLIVIGHQKDGHGDGEIQVDQINLTGKLKTQMCSVMDGIGRVYREGDTLMVDFRGGTNTDAGTRLPALAGKFCPLEWSTIYPDMIK